jgi:hypothetical protein
MNKSPVSLLMNEFVPLWYICKSSPVPSFSMSLSPKTTLPLKVASVLVNLRGSTPLASSKNISPPVAIFL